MLLSQFGATRARALAVVSTGTLVTLWCTRRRWLTKLLQKATLFVERFTGPPELPPKTLLDYEALAQRRLSCVGKRYYGYVDSDGVTYRATRAAFDAIRLMPSILRGAASVDTSITCLGGKTSLALPVCAQPESSEWPGVGPYLPF